MMSRESWVELDDLTLVEKPLEEGEQRFDEERFIVRCEWQTKGQPRPQFVITEDSEI